MNGYLLGIMGTVLLCSLLTAIAPEGKTSSVIKGVARLACVLAIVSPVLAFLEKGEMQVFSKGEDFFAESVIEEDGSFIQYYCEMRVRETEAALERELEEKYQTQTEVAFTWQREDEQFKTYRLEGIRIQSIRITLQKSTAEEVKTSMAAYIRENYCSEVLIE